MMRTPRRGAPRKPVAPPADPDAEDWAVVHALLVEMTDEDAVQTSFRQFKSELKGTSYDSITVEEFLDRFRMNRNVLVRGLRQRRAPDVRDDPTDLEVSGQSRAIGGVELSDLVRITLVAQNAFIARLGALADDRGIADELIIELLDYLDAWHSWTITGVISGYQEYALASIDSHLRRQDRALRQLLTGGLTAVEISRSASECGLDTQGAYAVLRVVTEGWAIGEMRRALVGAGVVSSEQAPLAMMYGDVCLIASELPSGTVPFIVGVSPFVRVDALTEGFLLATRATDAAKQTGRTGFVKMRDLSITASVATEREEVNVLHQRYIEPLLELGAAGQVILGTVAEFLRRRRNVAGTGRALFVHDNTVRYRLERFENVTGCSLKDVRTMTEVWWIGAELNRQFTFPHAPDA